MQMLSNVRCTSSLHSRTVFLSQYYVANLAKKLHLDDVVLTLLSVVATLVVSPVDDEASSPQPSLVSWGPKKRLPDDPVMCAPRYRGRQPGMEIPGKNPFDSTLIFPNVFLNNGIFRHQTESSLGEMHGKKYIRSLRWCSVWKLYCGL